MPCQNLGPNRRSDFESFFQKFTEQNPKNIYSWTSRCDGLTCDGRNNSMKTHWRELVVHISVGILTQCALLLLISFTFLHSRPWNASHTAASIDTLCFLRCFFCYDRMWRLILQVPTMKFMAWTRRIIDRHTSWMDTMQRYLILFSARILLKTHCCWQYVHV